MRYRVEGQDWAQEYVVRRGPLGREWEISAADGHAHSLSVSRLEEEVFRVNIAGKTHTLTLLPGNQPGRPLRFVLDGQYIELDVRDEFDLLEELLGDASGGSGAEDLEAVMPGIIKKVLVSAGDTVTVDQPVLILEAMKMENEIRSPVAGVVEAVHVSEGATVAGGTKLARIVAT